MSRRTATLLTLACLLWSGLALAQDTGLEDPGQPAAAYEDQPDEVLYVDDQAVIRARQELGLALREMGYSRKRVRNGREIYVNQVPWKPQVVVDDDGWMLVRRAPPSLGKPDLPGIWGGPLGYLVCLANPTACIHIGGWVISERKLAWHKQAVVEHADPPLGRYEDALIQRAFNDHTGEELPSALEALWEHGLPLSGQTPLPSYPERRAALLEHWLSRSCNDWGEAVQQVLQDFMSYEVQQGPYPFTTQELAAANAQRRCEARLVIQGVE